MLLGRDHEQQALVRLLEDARTGVSGVLVIVGDAGIGKSALLAYAEENATGMNVLRARGVQSEAHIPFAGLFELLRPALPWISQVPDPQATALESALALRPAASAPGRFAVGAATLSLLAACAEKAPVVPPEAPLAANTSVARVYLQRLRTLPQRTRDALVLASAVDDGEVPVLARAAPMLGLDLSDLVPAEAAGLVTVHDSRVEFRHPLARSAIYGDAPTDRRRTVHRALASAFPDTEADRRAWHLALASFGPDDAASSALEQAGQRAFRRGAYEVSSRAFERAARLAPDEARQDRLLYAAADAAWIGGLAERAVALLDQVSRHVPDPDLAVAIEHLRGHIAWQRGSISAAQEILLAAAERAAPIDPDRAVEMLAEVVAASNYAGDAATMRLAAERAASLLRPDAERRTTFLALLVQGVALIFSGQGEPGAPAIRAAVEVLEGSDELRDDPRLLAWAALGPLYLREAEVGRALASRAEAQARRTSAVGVLSSALSLIAIDEAATDRWPEAQADFHEAIALAREAGQLTDLGLALARLAWLEARQGRSEQSRLHGDEALGLSRDMGLGHTEVWAMAALGELELTLGRADAALARFEELRAVLRSHGIGDPDLCPAPELVEIYLRLGRAPEAAKVAEEFTRDASAKAQPWALARAARCRGLIAAEGESDPHFETALALHAKTPDAFETARTHLAYGARLRRERQRVRAREQLRAAIGTFDRLGADPWSEMARTELAATGETARRRDVTTLNDLTPQELQIAISLAEGRTTRADRHRFVPEPEDHRVSPAQRVPQAVHRIAQRAQGRDGPARGRINPTRESRAGGLQQLS